MGGRWRRRLGRTLPGGTKPLAYTEPISSMSWAGQFAATRFVWGTGWHRFMRWTQPSTLNSTMVWMLSLTPWWVRAASIRWGATQWPSPRIPSIRDLSYIAECLTRAAFPKLGLQGARAG